LTASRRVDDHPFNGRYRAIADTRRGFSIFVPPNLGRVFAFRIGDDDPRNVDRRIIADLGALLQAP
jgi:hypothetical protein